MLMTYSLMGKADQITSPIPLSEYGTQNAKIDIAYDGPTEAAGLADMDAKVHLDINDLSMKNDLGNLDLVAHLVGQPEGNDRVYTISLHESSEQTAHADELGQKHFADMLKTLQKASVQADDPGMQILQKISLLGQPEATVAKIYPRFSTLGKSAFAFDLTVKGPKSQTAFLQHSTVALENLNFTTTPYGILMKGSGNGPLSGKPLGGDITVTCVSCDALIADLGNYAMRVEQVFDAISNPPKSPYLSGDLIEGAKQFLHGVAENGSAKDLIIHFVMNGTGFTVSGKQLPEVMAIYMNTIAPHVPQPGAAGGKSPDQASPALAPGE
jgi:hypothetical protein